MNKLQGENAVRESSKLVLWMPRELGKYEEGGEGGGGMEHVECLELKFTDAENLSSILGRFSTMPRLRQFKLDFLRLDSPLQSLILSLLSFLSSQKTLTHFTLSLPLYDFSHTFLIGLLSIIRPSLTFTLFLTTVTPFIAQAAVSYAITILKTLKLLNASTSQITLKISSLCGSLAILTEDNELCISVEQSREFEERLEKEGENVKELEGVREGEEYPTIESLKELSSILPASPPTRLSLQQPSPSSPSSMYLYFSLLLSHTFPNLHITFSNHFQYSHNRLLINFSQSPQSPQQPSPFPVIQAIRNNPRINRVTMYHGRKVGEMEEVLRGLYETRVFLEFKNYFPWKEMEKEAYRKGVRGMERDARRREVYVGVMERMLRRGVGKWVVQEIMARVAR